MKRCFITFMVIAFTAGATIARVSAAKQAKERKEAVNSIVLAVQEEETVVEQPIYFDVPLSHDVQEHIFAECEKYSIDPAVIVAMINHESKFDTYAIGDDGRSFGLMQIRVKCHIERIKMLDCTDLFDPCQNITVGIDILAEQLKRYGGDMAKALTAYNRGSYNGTVTNYAKEILRKACE